MRFVEFLDVDVPGAGALGTIEFDPWLAAVASLKTLDGKTMVTHWIDPSPAMSVVENDQFQLRDAAHDGVMKMVTGAAPLGKSKAINGQPTFTATVASTLSQGSSPDVNKGEWSLIAVHDLTPAISTNYALFGIGGGALSGGLFPNMEVTSDASGATNITVREGGTSTRRCFRIIPDLMSGPAISVATFSTDLGFSVWKNNMVGFFRDASDKRALTVPTFSYLGNRSAGVAALGKFGMAFILRVDLSRDEYKSARDIIIDGLMSKYGVV